MNIPMHSKGCVDKNTVLSINSFKVQTAMDAQTVLNLNKAKNSDSSSIQTGSVIQTNISGLPTKKPIPKLKNPVQKGQKISLGENLSLDALFGWNVNNSNCDVDVSAFLLGENGKVLGDDWFVFYGQSESPDKSINLLNDDGVDRQRINIDFKKLHSNVKKIVFVLTINEALENNLNFSMIEDAYIRIMNEQKDEIVSFVMSDYYNNVISMMIGEIYLYNGAWKFSSVGNGVAKDLAGLCELYGVVVD